MRKGKPDKEDIPHDSDEKLNKLWEELKADLISKGISITFKPVRFRTKAEREGVMIPWDKPTQEEINKYPEVMTYENT